MFSKRLSKDPPMELDKITESEKEPKIFSIQHFCLHDGPGMRSVIFFKGCPLRCSWCQNPESCELDWELAFKKDLCIGCGQCVQGCSEKAMLQPGVRDMTKCTHCFFCSDHCPSTALEQIGKTYTVKEVFQELRPEFPFLKSTNGGITFSGGEPTLFSNFAHSLSKKLKEENIHLAAETCGLFISKGSTREFISSLDLLIFDIKFFDNEPSVKHCGVKSDRIKENLAYWARKAEINEGPPVWPRFPLVPTITDADGNIEKWAEFLKGLGLLQATIIPYHNMGESKRKWLDIPPGAKITPPTDDELSRAATLFNNAGIETYSPGEENWVIADNNPTPNK